MIYLDASALVKLVVSEPESRTLRAYLRREPRHLAAARLIAPTLNAVVTYDRRMAVAAESLGFAATVPA